MTKPIFLLAHGWAGAPALWDQVVAALHRAGIPADDVHHWDQGYFGAPHDPVPPPSRPVIGIGHSLGVALLLGRGGLAGLLAINGFSRFTSQADFTAGTPPRLLSQMRRRFATDPATVLADFTARAGLPLPAGEADNDRLAQGLNDLAEIDSRTAPLPAAFHALAGLDDPIVTQAHSEACFPGRVEWLPGGHALPLTAAEACAAAALRLAAEC
jgi:pimeloyl-[acyl-carrier protein] methyl ester esterase